MDRNYDISSLGFSLELLSATKAVGCILNASRAPEDLKINRGDFESDVMDRIKRSGLPPRLRELLENLAKPMGDELILWYHESYTRFRPYWTPQGTVDTVKCVRIILNDKRVNRGLRLALACKFCRKKHLDGIYDEILATGNDPKSVAGKFSNKFVNFWAEMYLTNRRVQRRSFFTRGFVLATDFFTANEVALQYFLNKVSLTDANKYMDDAIGEDYDIRHSMGGDFNFRRRSPHFSPATYCALYRRLYPLVQNSMANKFAVLMLEAHLKWPHQQRFLEAARELVPLLTAGDYFRVLTLFSTRVESGYKEVDYQKLYADFWELGNVHRRGESGSSRTTWPLNWPGFYHFLKRDERIIRFVLSGLPNEVKEALLLDFPANELHLVLHSDKVYSRLEVYIRCCGMHSEDLLVRLRHTFASDRSVNEFFRLSSVDVYSHRWKLRDWEDAFVRITEMIDRIIADKRAADAVG